jgi:hypothetical protein
MAQEYLSNIKIADLTLEIQPEQYNQEFTKMGSFKRTVSGNLSEVTIGTSKLEASISGLTQTQIEAIKKRCSLNKVINFIDYVPIAEKSSQTRTVFEDLSSETIDSELIYLYIPIYRVRISDFKQTYSGNIVTYTIEIREI